MVNNSDKSSSKSKIISVKKKLLISLFYSFIVFAPIRAGNCGIHSVDEPIDQFLHVFISPKQPKQPDILHLILNSKKYFLDIIYGFWIKPYHHCGQFGLKGGASTFVLFACFFLNQALPHLVFLCSYYIYEKAKSKLWILRKLVTYNLDI